LILPLTLALVGCDKEADLGALSVLLPERGARPTDMTLRSAFAEHVELPELRRELRLTFATYELSCDEYREPSGSDLAVIVTLHAPPSAELKKGVVPAVAPEAPETTDGGTPAIELPSVLGVVRREHQSFVLPSGGTIELSHVDVAPGGHVRGLLSLEFPGDAARPASAVRGRFNARMCRAR
jgi:hypothetical protein